MYVFSVGSPFFMSNRLKAFPDFSDRIIEINLKYDKSNLKKQKDKCKKQGIPYIYNRNCRDSKNSETPKNNNPVITLPVTPVVSP